MLLDSSTAAAVAAAEQDRHCRWGSALHWMFDHTDADDLTQTRQHLAGSGADTGACMLPRASLSLTAGIDGPRVADDGCSRTAAVGGGDLHRRLAAHLQRMPD